MLTSHCKETKQPLGGRIEVGSEQLTFGADVDISEAQLASDGGTLNDDVPGATSCSAL